MEILRILTRFWRGPDRSQQPEKDLLDEAKSLPPDDAQREDDEAFDPEQPVEIPIEDSIDLHTFSPKETRSVVEEYLEAAADRGFREVRIIHGRGKGVQRRIIRSALAKHPLVESFTDAPPQRGGWGATLAYLGKRF